MNNEVYFSIDVEATGPIAGKHSILQLATTAFTKDDLLGTWSANLEELPGAGWDPATKAWWNKQDQAIFTKIRQNLQKPGTATRDWDRWVRSFGSRPKVAVASPTGYDWTLLAYYIYSFIPGWDAEDRTPFKHRCLDIRSYSAAYLNKGYLESSKADLEHLRPKNIPHNHDAAQDSLEQAVFFQNLLKANDNLHRNAHLFLAMKDGVQSLSSLTA